MYKTLKTEIKNNVGIITLDRPEAMNALCEELAIELTDAIETFDQSPDVHVLILTGNDKAFAAGADIKEITPKSFNDVYKDDFIFKWECVARCRKPIIAAISGYALGGGCEIAMMCDMIIASETAKFSQPEITIGILPGAGGTQRLTKAVGKAKAMEICLTGRMFTAQEAEQIGLITKVVAQEQLHSEALALAEKIASYSLPVTMMIKEAINHSFETTLSEGVHFERRLFHGAFSLEDRKEGMQAFIEKRQANYKNK